MEEKTASVYYEIAKADPTATAPTGLTATYGQTLADVTLTNPSGNTEGTWAWADSSTSVGGAGEKTFKANFTPTDTTNYNSVSNVDVTVTVGKAANPATVTSTATVMRGGNTVDLADNVTLNGATGDVSYAISGEANGCSISGSVLTSGDNTGTVAVNVTVAADDNYNASEQKTITVTINDKNTQTITAADVTVAYGETGKSISATTDGDGALSYAVKDGSEDYIDVDTATGALTIKKAGTATVVVTAAETSTYAQATKEVTVTVNKANATPATVTANNRTYDGTEKPLVTVTGEASGGTLYYAVTTENTAPTDESLYTTSIPTATDAGTYYVWYKVAGDENHNDTEPKSVTVTIGTNSYAIVADAQDWTKGSSSNLTVTFKGKFADDKTYEKWNQRVLIDGAEIATSSYDDKAGSLVIDLKPAYLETLSTGKHTISVTFSDGSASGTFNIKAKSSSGGGSSKPDKKTDNVVTCQMAGYPANYAWNEATKACQPGYLDNNGVFHPASNGKKSAVPNTYDRGMRGSVISLTVSTITAIIAAFLLKKYQ